MSIREQIAAVQQRLRERYPTAQIDLSGGALPDGCGHVVVSRIVLPKEQRRQGIGTAIMTELHQVADENGWLVSGTPSTAFGGTRAGLDRFYRRLGYVSNRGRHADFRISDALIRRPVR